MQRFLRLSEGGAHQQPQARKGVGTMYDQEYVFENFVKGVNPNVKHQTLSLHDLQLCGLDISSFAGIWLSSCRSRQLCCHQSRAYHLEYKCWAENQGFNLRF